MLVDTTVMPNPEQNKDPLWLMNFPTISTIKSDDSTTSLWRNKKGVVQLYPNEYAVTALLNFLGFSKVEKIIPTQNGLEERYYNGKRVTFIAIR